MKESACKSLYSYVVTYDSGFAPNPFNGFCTLATCKPSIRCRTSVGDYIIGTGSDRKNVRRGGFLVYAMRVRETMNFEQYWSDTRFEKKKPHLYGDYERACGDNIYCPLEGGGWRQLNSYHSNKDGSPNHDHISRDTSVDRVLISDDFVYFGGEGPKIPDSLESIVLQGRGYKRSKDWKAVAEFENWLKSLRAKGCQGRPLDHD